MQENILETAKKYVNKLLTPLESHYYHQYEHAIDVMGRAIYLAEKEGLTKDEVEILGLAGLFHDTGFIIQYDNNEQIGAKIAKNFLKSILYSEEKIETIEGLIIATDPDYIHPKNILEKIIKDADLDNLGRDDFFQKGNNLKKELETIKKIKIKDPAWHHGSLDLLYGHRYYTKTQKRERIVGKEENKKILENMIKELDEMDINNKIKIEL